MPLQTIAMIVKYKRGKGSGGLLFWLLKPAFDRGAIYYRKIGETTFSRESFCNRHLISYSVIIPLWVLSYPLPLDGGKLFQSWGGYFKSISQNAPSQAAHKRSLRTTLDAKTSYDIGNLSYPIEDISMVNFDNYSLNGNNEDLSANNSVITCSW